jgi:hypothetical protein
MPTYKVCALFDARLYGHQLFKVFHAHGCIAMAAPKPISACVLFSLTSGHTILGTNTSFA